MDGNSLRFSSLPCEASVFFVMLLSIDRFICIRFPYSTRKLTQTSVTMLAILTCIVSLELGIVPSLLAGRYRDFYDNSCVCISLPLNLAFAERMKWIAFYEYEHWWVGTVKSCWTLLFNYIILGCCELIVLLSGTWLLGLSRAVKKSATNSGRSLDMVQQIKLAKNVTSIVAKDFFCWAPIIILGILVQTRVILSLLVCLRGAWFSWYHSILLLTYIYTPFMTLFINIDTENVKILKRSSSLRTISECKKKRKAETGQSSDMSEVRVRKTNFSLNVKSTKMI